MYCSPPPFSAPPPMNRPLASWNFLGFAKKSPASRNACLDSAAATASAAAGAATPGDEPQ